MLELQAMVARVAMDFYQRAGHMSLEIAKHHLMAFYQCYTVDSQSASVDVRDAPTDPNFQQSSFRVELVDNFGYLLRFFRKVEKLVADPPSNCPPIIAVDFEGVKLCRNGELCLAQFCLHNDQCTVYVLDVFTLGKQAFTIQSPRGTSVQSILEDPSIRKVWFDPRNDVDALHHQFGIKTVGIFDLQVAEVAERRNRGLGVRYVQGLFKCLTNCPTLSDQHKLFAEKIDILGKNLFEPENGGSYEVFRMRPLHPIILVYAAHDVRYMLLLYEALVLPLLMAEQQGRAAMNPGWFARIEEASKLRGNWWRHPEYVEPSSEAPDF